MSSEDSTRKNWATTMMVVGVLGLVVAAFGLIPPYWSTFFATQNRADAPGAQQDAVPGTPSQAAPDPAVPGTTPPQVPTGVGSDGTPEPPPEEPPAREEPAEANTPAREPEAAADTGGGDGHSGPLNVSIDLGERGQVGPATYRQGATPGANTKVYDAGGRVDRGCYVQWTLSRDGTVVHTERSGRCEPPGVTLFNFGDSLDEVGSYRLQADVTTDWGEKGSASESFTVVAGD
ncbi:hypothetical protein [Streptomyces sp. NPDC015131]|uniref:hypothetical protein n=1 Tax=Streptomyces sp. NPDC015131 TaxID=3364941 RepID=UPI003700942E